MLLTRMYQVLDEDEWVDIEHTDWPSLTALAWSWKLPVREIAPDGVITREYHPADEPRPGC